MLQSLESKLNTLIEQRKEKFRRSIKVQLLNNNGLTKVEVIVHYAEEKHVPFFEEILEDIDKNVIKEILEDYSKNGFIIKITDNIHFKRMNIWFKKGEGE